MKRLDVKKLAAIGAGAALIGLALAPIAAAALTKKDVLKGNNTPFDVVVGKNAATSDYLWAGNIAAKLAQLATEDTQVSCTVNGWQAGKGPGTAGTPTPCKGLSVDLTVGGTQTYTGSKLYDSLDLNSQYNPATPRELIAELSQSSIASLYDTSKNWTFKGTAYNQAIKEYIGVQGDAKFEYVNKQNGYITDDLVMYLDREGDFNYRVHYSKGLPVDNGVSSTDDFTQAANDNVIAVLFGKEYKLYSANTTRSGGSVSSVDKIKLVKTSGEKSYNVGQKIEGLVGAGEYDGKTMYVMVDNVWSATSADLSLYDDQGNVVSTFTGATAGSYLEQNFWDSQSQYALDTSLYLKTVNFNAATGSGNVVIAKGGDMVTIQNASEYPYNSTSTDSTVGQWKATLTKGTQTNPDVNVITDITIYNSDKRWKYSSDNSYKPIYAGATWSLTDTGKAGVNTAVFLDGFPNDPGYGYATVEFDGFKGTEARTNLTIANGPYIEYKDSSDNSHKVPFFFDRTASSTGSSFMLDTQTFYYKVNAADVNFTLGADNNTLNGIDVIPSKDGNIMSDHGVFPGNNGALNITATVDVNGETFLCTPTETTWTFNCLADGNFQISTTPFSSASTSEYIGSTNVNKSWYYDANNSKNSIAADNTDIKSVVSLVGNGTQSKTYKYAFNVSSSGTGDLWLMLDAKTDFDLQYSKDIQLYGTDTTEDGVVDQSYYLPNKTELGGGNSNLYYVATFGVLDNTVRSTAWDTRVYVVTDGDGALWTKNDNLSWYDNDVNYYSGPNSHWVLKMTDPKEYLQAAYTDWGSKFDIRKGYFEASIPQNREELKILVKGTATTTETTGGNTLTLEPGVEQSIGSTTYNVANITCDTCQATGSCSVQATDVDVTPSVKTVKALQKIGSQIVFTDEDALGTNVVIVGGHLINSKAADATFADNLTLADKLTSAGQTVVEQTTDGDWVVAGFTAGDTASAAKEFIGMLDAAFD